MMNYYSLPVVIFIGYGVVNLRMLGKITIICPASTNTRDGKGAEAASQENAPSYFLFLRFLGCFRSLFDLFDRQCCDSIFVLHDSRMRGISRFKT